MKTKILFVGICILFFAGLVSSNDQCCNCVTPFVPEPTTCGVGACASTGETVCIDGSVSDTCVPGEPTTEICDDGIDNDCDGSTDCADTEDCSDSPYCGDSIPCEQCNYPNCYGYCPPGQWCAMNDSIEECECQYREEPPTVPEFGSLAALIAILLTAPSIAYMFARRYY